MNEWQDSYLPPRKRPINAKDDSALEKRDMSWQNSLRGFPSGMKPYMKRDEREVQGRKHSVFSARGCVTEWVRSQRFTPMVSRRLTARRCRF